MRVALCLSGQPRGIPVSVDMMLNNVIAPNGITDVFLHAWHDEKDVGKPYGSAQPYHVGTTGFVKPNTATMLMIRYKPIACIIEPQKEFPHLRSLRSAPTANQEQLGSNFYSVWQSNELKKKYEQQQKFKYDIVIRSRYDLWFKHPVVVSGYSKQITAGKIVLRKRYQDDQDGFNNPDKPMVDVFAFGSSEVMDVFSTVYPNMEQLNKEINPVFGENYLGRHVRVNNSIELYKAPFEFEILHRVVDLSRL